jgi:glutamine synthetase
MAKLQPELYSFFRDLPQNGRITAEYIWIGGNGPLDIRSKTKCLDAVPSSAEELPEWNYDGSSTNQAPGEDSEVLLIPRAIFKDPFRGGGNILVVADTYSPADRAPLPSNSRAEASSVFERVKEHEVWFGIEQEYTLFQSGRPLGWPSCTSKSFSGPCVQIGYPAPQGPYYCAVGADVAFGREVVEAHLKLCLAAGVTISGVNGEVMPGQWEYQVGPCVGVAAADEMLISRYLMLRVGEVFDVVVRCCFLSCCLPAALPPPATVFVGGPPAHPFIFAVLIPSPCPETGTVPAATPMSAPKARGKAAAMPSS